MATPRRTIVYAPAALRDLTAIWRWNAERHGPSWADDYLRFLRRAIDQLALSQNLGRPVLAQPEFMYRLVRRKAKGHGHVVVYRVVDSSARVLHIFHTAQDWQTAILEE